MSKVVKKIGALYDWWTANLLACLPEKWADSILASRSRFDLVITHQGDTIFITTSKGEILDSFSASEENEIESNSLAIDRRLQPDLESVQDPPISLNVTTLDFDLATHEDQAVRSEAVDFPLGVGGDDSGLGDCSHKNINSANNVIALTIQKSDDDTVVLEDEDETIGFIASSPDDDTIIIQNNQGKLLQFEPLPTESRDPTILFQNDGGRIRQVVADDYDTSVEANAEEDNPSAQQYLEENSHGSDDSIDYLIVAKLLATYQANKKCLYLLPDKKAFILNLSYPVEAIQDIETVLRYDLEKHIPVSFQEIRYFYALNINAKLGKVNAEVAVIKSNEYSQLNQSLSPYLKNGLLCTTEKFYNKYGSKINFLEQARESTWDTYFKFSVFHSNFNWILIFIVFALPFFMFLNGTVAIEEKSAAEVSRVKKLVSEFNLVNSESSYGSDLASGLNEKSRAIELLTILSTSISGQAWLHQFSFKNNQIKIKGEALSATTVSDDLNGTGLFQSIKFVSSIIKNPRNNKETFELLLNLKNDS